MDLWTWVMQFNQTSEYDPSNPSLLSNSPVGRALLFSKTSLWAQQTEINFWLHVVYESMGDGQRVPYYFKIQTELFSLPKNPIRTVQHLSICQFNRVFVGPVAHESDSSSYRYSVLRGLGPTKTWGNCPGKSTDVWAVKYVLKLQLLSPFERIRNPIRPRKRVLTGKTWFCRYSFMEVIRRSNSCASLASGSIRSHISLAWSRISFLSNQVPDNS